MRGCDGAADVTGGDSGVADRDRNADPGEGSRAECGDHGDDELSEDEPDCHVERQSDGSTFVERAGDGAGDRADRGRSRWSNARIISSAMASTDRGFGAGWGSSTGWDGG